MPASTPAAPKLNLTDRMLAGNTNHDGRFGAMPDEAERSVHASQTLEALVHDLE